jgi:hypothetical protein
MEKNDTERNGERTTKVAAELLLFTSERLPSYQWLRQIHLQMEPVKTAG